MRFEISDGKSLVKFAGKTFLPTTRAQEISGRIRRKFWRNIASNFTSFYGIFVQHKGDAKTMPRTERVILRRFMPLYVAILSLRAQSESVAHAHLTSLTLLALFDFFVFFSDFPCFFARFSFFSKDFRVLRREKPLLFSGFPLQFPKNARVGGPGFMTLHDRAPFSNKKPFGTPRFQCHNDAHHGMMLMQMSITCSDLAPIVVGWAAIPRATLVTSPQCTAKCCQTPKDPVLPFLVFLEKGQENHQKKTRIFIPTEPLKSLEKKGKTLKKTRNSSQEEKTRNSKTTRKGRTGEVGNNGILFRGCWMHPEFCPVCS